MMKQKSAFSIILAILLVLGTSEICWALVTTDIDHVRSKAVLGSKDFQIIDRFLADGVDELLKTEVFASIAQIRATITSRSASETDSAQGQYAEQFSESAHKHISLGLKKAENLTPESRKIKIKMNLLILIDNLQDARLVDLATGQLENNGNLVRYWAVHCITDHVVVDRFAKTASGTVALGQISDKLQAIVADSSPEVLRLIVDFTDQAGTAQTRQLLSKIADLRIKQYADWTVKNELLDAAVLKALDGKISSSNSDRPALARQFAQLYSYVIQRYLKGGQLLNDQQNQQLASVMAETEMACIGKILGISQAVIKNAIGKGAFRALQAEHDRLLGTDAMAGQLGLKLGFDYGKAPDGSALLAPLALPDPPKP
ncbi:MAG: hypothetical protein ACYSRR_05805 [Planctomycetota bacterium]|jgi:hypothetical protein